MPGWGVAAGLVGEPPAASGDLSGAWLRGVAVHAGKFDSGTTVTTRVTSAIYSPLVTSALRANKPIPKNVPSTTKQQQQSSSAATIRIMSRVRFCVCIEL